MPQIEIRIFQYIVWESSFSLQWVIIRAAHINFAWVPPGWKQPNGNATSVDRPDCAVAQSDQSLRWFLIECINLKLSHREHTRPWSECTDAQANLGLRSSIFIRLFSVWSWSLVTDNLETWLQWSGISFLSGVFLRLILTVTYFAGFIRVR